MYLQCHPLSALHAIIYYLPFLLQKVHIMTDLLLSWSDQFHSRTIILKKNTTLNAYVTLLNFNPYNLMFVWNGQKLCKSEKNMYI